MLGKYPRRFVFVPLNSVLWTRFVCLQQLSGLSFSISYLIFMYAWVSSCSLSAEVRDKPINSDQTVAASRPSLRSLLCAEIVCFRSMFTSVWCICESENQLEPSVFCPFVSAYELVRFVWMYLETNIYQAKRLCEWAIRWMFCCICKMRRLYLIWRVDRGSRIPQKVLLAPAQASVSRETTSSCFYFSFGSVYLKGGHWMWKKNKYSLLQLAKARFQTFCFSTNCSCGLVSC